jgi:uncharacterized protein (TIGR00251 family)
VDVPWIRAHPDGCLVDVWVVPNAHGDSLVGVHGDALKVRISVPAEKGRATNAVAGLLQEATGARAVRLDRGAASRRKQFVLVGVSPNDAEASLGA